MEFSIKTRLPEKARGTVVAALFAGGKFTDDVRLLDEASGGALTALLARGDLSGKAGSVVPLFGLPGLACARLLLVGLGEEERFGPERYRAAVAAAVAALKNSGATKEILFALASAAPWENSADRIRETVLAIRDAAYVFTVYKRGKHAEKADAEKPLPPFVLPVTRAEQAAARAALAEGEAIADGIDLARDLGNQPANVCTPVWLQHTVEKLARAEGLRCKVLEQKDMEKLGMNALLAVAKGSSQPPRLILLKWKGGREGEAPIALVGKGITFDSGGISLKPAANMDEMKYDMCGAAAVLGTLYTAARLKLPLNLVAVIPACENMPGSTASRPGDIVTSLSGQTIEILNTDAEGRLILCDALAYAETRYAPETLIDVATLTGACMVALGHVASGLFSRDEALAGALEAAGASTGDRVWRLPLWEDYQEALDSPFADMTNTGGRPAGAITAACFLARFTQTAAWAHLDIAGTAWKSGKNKGATGRPVALLTRFLLDRAAQQQAA
ncbi:MAG: leucyl aminopeptidase [Zoogloeaceae bacterium]|nr:leucyl aminopeptidase [Zoogloeaceae bacterium]